MSWENKNFKELGFLGRGKSRHRPRNDESLYGGKYPLVQTGDVKAANFFLKEYSQTYNEKGLAQSKLWEPNTLCITIAANIAETAILGMRACFPDSIIGFIADEEESDVRFIKYFFDIYKERMQRISQGATQDNLSLEKLLTFEVPTPPLQTQKRIADILSAYDDLIENNLKRIKLLEQAAQNIYKEWFVNFRFPGHESTTINEETGLPEGWEKKSLGEILSKLESGSRPKGGINKSLKVGIPSIGAESVRELGYFDFSKTKYVEKDFFIKMKKGILEDKDILVYKDGAYIGRSTLFQDNFPFEQCSINEHIFLIHAKEEELQYYLYFTLHSDVYFEMMQNLNSNAAQPGINQKKIKTLQINIPSNELLLRFDSFSESSVKQIYKLARKNFELKKARDILLPRLMNRTIEV